LDENLNRLITTFDEVRHLKIAFATPWCDLKRVPPKSRPAAPSREEAARKDPAVHVSLSSDSPVKQPGTGVVPFSRKPGRAIEAHASDCDRKLVYEHLSEGFVGAPSRRSGRRAVENVYMPPAFRLSTAAGSISPRGIPCQPLWAGREKTAIPVWAWGPDSRAVLRPHSSVVLASWGSRIRFMRQPDPGR
jgi:hypothetical protein